MRILLVTDIHGSYDAARSAFISESPDLVLDCGDHDKIINLFELIPHYFVLGNHFPRSVEQDVRDFPAPSKLVQGLVYGFKSDKSEIRVAGFDGNYGSHSRGVCIDKNTLQDLKRVEEDSVDLLIFHESPINVKKTDRLYQLARDVKGEIGRINPKLVISGHSGVFDDRMLFGSRMITLDDMSRGYGVLDINGEDYNFRRVKAVFSGRSDSAPVQ